ncbi:acetyl-CoA acyltransferase [Desulfacinum infernum DSM 9756]|uniref:acetyl-CoA C-acyltransferase n=1 Tax=Desulfacinum infernum DSM 9756 TaxID=1121391 RepID=A0A1M5GAW3_9BACT|nr:thiolase family protein [Desulfacinum infernum]SHG00950.1 acetyl-CoA acyltransferase [Desulfacinum infernum DSM 9756]
MNRPVQEVVVVDSVRTPFGRAGEKGIYWKTRAEDLAVAVLKALVERNPALDPSQVEDCLWGVTNQVKEQGGTLGRMVSLLADWGWGVPGCSIDRMCAGGLTAVHFGASVIASGMADCIVSGGVEHMGHLPMGVFRDLHPRAVEALGDETALSMGLTAENIHDQWPDLTRERADRYAWLSQQKASMAIQAGKMGDMIVPMEVELPDGTRTVVERDQTPRPTTTLEGLAQLQPVFRPDGRVTAGNACPLTDGAAGVVLMSRRKAESLGLRPRMRWVATGVAAVDPRIMGTAPVPATCKALEKAGLALDQMDIIEINEAFAVQVLYFLDRMGLAEDDPRVNIWGGAIAYGHPLAASGPRLVAFLQRLFAERPDARYGLTTMCVGRGQGVSIIWENLASAA